MAGAQRLPEEGPEKEEKEPRPGADEAEVAGGMQIGFDDDEPWVAPGPTALC